MITLRKLAGLSPSVRLRKASRILREAGRDLSRAKPVNFIYLHQLGKLLLSDDLPEALFQGFMDLTILPETGDPRELGRFCDSLHFQILESLGTSPADWDLRDSHGSLDLLQRKILPFRVYLDDLRSPFNVGSVFRTAEAFGVEKIALSQATPGPDHPRAARTAMGCGLVVPWERGSVADLVNEPGIFALELGGCDLTDFEFPARGTVILGSEELGISPAAEKLVNRGLGKVSIPLWGSKGSLNVSVSFGILMYTWFLKAGGFRGGEPGQFPAD